MTAVGEPGAMEVGGWGDGGGGVGRGKGGGGGIHWKGGEVIPPRAPERPANAQPLSP